MESNKPTMLAPSPMFPEVQNKTLQGSVLVLIQFDVSEEIRLDQLRDIVGARRQEVSFKHPAPGYVQYQRPPVVERIEPLVLESGEWLDGQIKYYDYGVLSVVFELPFAGDWETLIRMSSRWVWDTDFTSFAQKIVRQKLERAQPALVKAYPQWLNEDYFIFHVREIAGNPSAVDLLAAEGGRIAQIVRGETVPLSDVERQEILQSRISYYANDLGVIGWNAAFVYDTAAGAKDKALLLRAVALNHTDLTDFVLHHSLLAAKAVIKEADRVRLSGRDTMRVLDLLENPPAPNAKLLAAARRLPKRG